MYAINSWHCGYFMLFLLCVDDLSYIFKFSMAKFTIWMYVVVSL